MVDGHTEVERSTVDQQVDRQPELRHPEVVVDRRRRVPGERLMWDRETHAIQSKSEEASV